MIAAACGGLPRRLLPTSDRITIPMRPSGPNFHLRHDRRCPPQQELRLRGAICLQQQPGQVVEVDRDFRVIEPKASAAMSLSSVLVISNALRLRTTRL